jgi:hypothetical protein
MADVTLNFSLVPGLTEIVDSVLRCLLDGLEDRIPRMPQIPDEDPDLIEWWKSSLRERFAEDAGVLREVLQSPGFGQGKVELSMAQAESLLRACSGLRLTIRQSVLGRFSDADLESGAVTPTTVTADEKEPLFCFWFLGVMQEAIVVEMLGNDSPPEAF